MLSGETVNGSEHRGSLAILGLALTLVVWSPARAQVIVGADAEPSVTVDLGVLDRLGDEPTLPDLFLGRTRTLHTAMVTPTKPTPASRTAVALRHPASITLRRPPRKTTKSLTAPAATRTLATGAMPASAPPPTPAESPRAIVTTASIETAPPAKEASPPQPAKEASPPQPVKEASSPLPLAPPPKTAEAPKTGVSEPVALTAPEKPGAAPPAKPVVVTPPSQVDATEPPAHQAPLATASADQPKPLPTINLPEVSAPPATVSMQVSRPDVAPAKHDSPPPPPPIIARPAAAPALPSAKPAGQPSQGSQEAHLGGGAAGPAGESRSSIRFDKDTARLPDDARTTLTKLASQLEADAAVQIELLAYAEGDEENASKARRLSLSRALAVRSFLIDQGVRSTRIEVRALGNKVPEGTADRVDLVLQKR